MTHFSRSEVMVKGFFSRPNLRELNLKGMASVVIFKEVGNKLVEPKLFLGT